MFIAHLPAAYLLSKRIIDRRFPQATSTQIRNFMLVAACASLLPDLDLIYFYFFDNAQHNHHTYWLHIPFYWLFIALFTTLTCANISKLKFLNPYFLIFYSNILLHLLLDSIVGGIQWLYPFSNELMQLVVVESKNSWWVANFIWHWTFGLELLIIYWTALVLVREKNRQSIQA